MGLIAAVGFRAVPARGTGAAGVPWVNQHDDDTRRQRLVCQKGPQLIERPSHALPALLVANRHALIDPGQIFQRECLARVFRRGDEALADDVVGVSRRSFQIAHLLKQDRSALIRQVQVSLAEQDGLLLLYDEIGSDFFQENEYLSVTGQNPIVPVSPLRLAVRVAMDVCPMGQTRFQPIQQSRAGICDRNGQYVNRLSAIFSVTAMELNTSFAVNNTSKVGALNIRQMPDDRCGSRGFIDAAGEPSVTSFGRVKLRVVTRGSDMPRGLYRGSPAASFILPLINVLLNTQPTGSDRDPMHGATRQQRCPFVACCSRVMPPDGVVFGFCIVSGGTHSYALPVRDMYASIIAYISLTGATVGLKASLFLGDSTQAGAAAARVPLLQPPTMSKPALTHGLDPRAVVGCAVVRGGDARHPQVHADVAGRLVR